MYAATDRQKEKAIHRQMDINTVKNNERNIRMM